MIKVLEVNAVPRLHGISLIRELMNEAAETLEKNPSKIIAVSRDDGKVLSTTMAKHFLPDGILVFSRKGQIYLKKGEL